MRTFLCCRDKNMANKQDKIRKPDFAAENDEYKLV